MIQSKKFSQKIILLGISSLLVCLATPIHANTMVPLKPATQTETPAAARDGIAGRQVAGTLPKGIFLQQTKEGAVLHNIGKQEVLVQGVIKQEILVQGMTSVPPGKKVELVGKEYKITVVNKGQDHNLTITTPMTLTTPGVKPLTLNQEAKDNNGAAPAR
jgi:hypothetical protein